MSYLVAKGTGKSLNGDAYEVRIIRNASGTDLLTEFNLAANGFALKYESVEDKFLVPGIVHGRLEVTTLWPSSVHNKLEQLITGLLSSEDGDYLCEVLHDSTRLFVGVIMVDEFFVDEDSTVREVTFTAADGISLLKHVEYNDDGTAYTGHQTVYDIIKNVQEKWPLYGYLNAQNSGTQYRLAWAEDVYSEDDYIAAAETHPAGTDLKTIQRSRINANVWSETTTDATTFVNCYDLLHSLCVTYQWRLFAEGDAWHLLPTAMGATENRKRGSVLQWNGTVVDRDVISQYDYQTDAANNIRQKDGAWTKGFTAPVNTCTLKRDTGGGPYILHEFNYDLGTKKTGAAIDYEGQDTASDDVFYKVHGSVEVQGTAIAGLTNSTAGIVLRFQIAFGPSGSEQYYKNQLADNSGSLQGFTFATGLSEIVPIGTVNPQYSGASSYFYYVPVLAEEFIYDASQDLHRYVQFDFMMPPPPTELTGVSVTPELLVFDSNGVNSTTYANALTTRVAVLAMEKRTEDTREAVEDFDIVARTSAGRGVIDLGTTYVGQLGNGMGRIDVQTSAGVYGSTQNWVNQASDDTREINTLAVEEVLAQHNSPRQVERGSIVLRGTSTTLPKPYSRFKDTDNGNFYTALNWQLNATQCEVDVTLRKTGRDAISVTTAAENTGKDVGTVGVNGSGQNTTTAVPVTRGYNTQANTIFAQDWSSVIGAGETLEAYYTVLPDGTGKKVNHQGETPATGHSINRKIYFRTLGLHESTGTGWLALPINQPDENATLEQAFENVDAYMSQLQNASYSFLITYKEVTDYVLNAYTGATAAYSLRKLSSSYTGNCIRVRRSSDNTTQDIGFNGDDLDTAAIATFCGSGNGFVQIIFDQSGNARNAQNFNTGEQPRIYNAGAMVTDNGKPAMEFDGSNDYLKTTASWPQNPNGALNIALVCNTDSFLAGQYIWNSWTTSSSTQVWAVNFMTSGKGRVAARYTTNGLPRMDSASALSTGTQYIITGMFDGHTTLAYYNGTEEDDKYSQNTAGTPRNTTLAAAIGARQSDGGLDFNGKIQECIVWSNSSAHDADEISDSLNEHYNAF